MGDPASDFASVISPYTVAGGIFDFSGTQENFQYTWVNDAGDKGGGAVTQEEVKEWTRFWWDGSSDEWTTDADFAKMRGDQSNPLKLVVGGVEYRIMKRVNFGENDGQHVILGRSKNSDWKTGCVLAHSDYTVCVGIYDEDEQQKDGPLQLNMTNLMSAYKESGF
eukprot:TRINITY_DN157_c0_g1_i1.p1 TRINITY_DN157_c0_g1~~TRINITY_DN157_c0_g1_i1.p1  ORF type:complete len:165 (-),score=40.45 TRINITY_DN157_c0_g1_i1:303-797(-)